MQMPHQVLNSENSLQQACVFTYAIHRLDLRRMAFFKNLSSAHNPPIPTRSTLYFTRTCIGQEASSMHRKDYGHRHTGVAEDSVTLLGPNLGAVDYQD
jgi:hypothetical protein